MGAAYLAKYGESVINNGYDIVAIRPGEKRPFGKNWEEKKLGLKTLASFIENDRGAFGVGIKTRRSPGVDIDCYDADLVDHMVAFVTDRIGDTLLRVGLPPKTLLACRCKTPFAKVQSRTYLDDEGRRVKLEVLADGQQYVALHVHPDTEKPYRWKDKRHPGNTPRSELAVIDQEDAEAFAAEFDRLATERGWPVASVSNTLAKRDGNYDYDDPFISDKAKVELPAEEIRKKLDKVPHPEDHDHWFQVGMALYHQFDGSDEGLQMWHEWSAQAHNYDQDVLDTRWRSFDVEGKKREPITARYILKKAQAEEERLAGERLDEIREAVAEARDFPAIRAVCDEIKREAFDVFTRNMLATIIQKRVDQINGTKMSIGAVRDLIRYENPENTATPPWMEPFVYLQARESFYSQRNNTIIKTKAFDASYGRYMMSKKDRLEGKTAPEHTASHAALNRYEIPSVFDTRYMPGHEPIFEMSKATFVNTFNEATLPEMPETFNRHQRRMIDRFVAHMEHLFPIDRDRKLLLSWMAHVVQTLGRSNWAPLIQGAEGDGKTTIGMALAVALGGDANCDTINGDALEEKYTAWAEGKLFVMMEEVRLHGENRFDVLNRMKTYITNSTVNVRRMQTDRYPVVNTVNYMMFSNFKNALPINDEDSRYFPIFSRWQNKVKLDAWKAAHPRYYAELQEVLQEPGALRKFFMEYELHPEFDPNGRAPFASAKKEMVALNRTEGENVLLDALEDSTDPMICEALLDPHHAMDTVDGLFLGQGKALSSFLSERGWTYLGRFKIDGRNRSLYSQDPERFGYASLNEKGIGQRVRDFLKDGGDVI